MPKKYSSTLTDLHSLWKHPKDSQASSVILSHSVIGHDKARAPSHLNSQTFVDWLLGAYATFFVDSNDIRLTYPH